MMSAELERVSLNNTSVNSAVSSGSRSGPVSVSVSDSDPGSVPGGRALSANVRRLHNALNLLLSDPERQQFIHCLNVYHAKRNVYDLVQTLKVILNGAGKRQLLPMLRLVIPRSDQLLFDQYTSEGLYLKPSELLAGNNGGGGAEGFGDDDGDSSALQTYVSSITEQQQQLSQYVSSITEQQQQQQQQQQLSSGCPDTASPLAPSSQCFLEGPFREARRVALTRSRSHEGLGFSIRGGAEHGVGIYVSLVEPGSSAEREGLRVGDQIVTVNDMVFDGVTHVEAVKVLKGCKKLVMSLCSMGRIPGGYVTNHVYSWVDPQGRPVSPPPDTQEADQRQGPGMEDRTVSLNMDNGRSLGLMIRGGAEYGLGIYITGVDPGSAADAGAIQVGDQILEVNGQSFVTISHDEAVHILKTGFRLLMKVRAVGRLPHARTVVDQTRWIFGQTIAESNATAANPPASSSSVPCPAPPVNAGIHANVCASTCGSRPTSARATPVLGKPAACRGVGPPGAQVSLEQQAYMLLTEAERQTMVYYLQEYQEGHIGLEPLVMALFELFNTHAKLSMLSEVRSLVCAQDLEQFDRLVLHREVEAHQAWHGGLLGVFHPQSQCNYAAPGLIHDAGHTFTAANDGSVGGWTEIDQAENTNALQNIALDERLAAGQSPPPFRAASPQTQSRKDPPGGRKPSGPTRQTKSGSGLLSGGPTRLLQDCLLKSLKSLPSIQPPPQHTCTAATSTAAASHHTSLNALHHTCHGSSSPQTSHYDPHGQPNHFPHQFHHHHPQQQGHTGHHSRPSSGHHTCPGFHHHRDSPSASVKLSSRSSSYERSSSVLSKSASSSKAASPMASPRPSPRPSPCPSPCPSLVTPPAAPSCSPDRPCSPAFTQKVLVTDMNRLSADSRPQQRGATLSQLSDSGQTLSEDSGVDIAEAGGLSKDGSPRPSKNQQGQPEQPGAPAIAPGATRQNGSPVPSQTATLVRVMKNANTLGIAIEGGANTRQPLPRIVTIQKGGSAHNCGQLRVGHVILEVNGVSLRGREHRDAARIIAEAFKTKDKDHIDFLVVEPGLSV